MNVNTDALLRRLQISHYDLEGAVAYIKQAQMHAPGSLEYEALVLSAIIHYARPFYHNEKPAKDQTLTTASRLDDMDVPTILGPDFDMHSRLLELRSKAVAHSESKYYPVTLAPHAREHGKGRVFISRRWIPAASDLNLADFLRVAETMRHHLMMRLSDLAAFTATAPLASA